MGVNILYGSSRASADKCFLLLPFLLLKAELGAVHSGWESAEPIPAGLAGSCPPREEVSPAAWEQRAGSWRVTPHTTRCAQGLEVSSAYAGSRSEQPSAAGRRGSPSIVGFHSYRQISFSACFYHFNSKCDNKNGSRETFGVLMNSFSKSIGKRDIIAGALPLTEN